MKRPTKKKYPFKPQSSISSGTPSAIGPVPFYPNLKRIVPNVTCALLVTYFEMRFPAPEYDPGRISSLPVVVSVDTVSHELAISRRTLGLSLYAIARVYKEEAERWRCARAYREFIQQHHRKKGTRKLYSIVCDYNLERAHTFILRRNIPLLRAAFANCGISASSLAETAQAWSDPGVNQDCVAHELAKVGVAPALISSPATLVDLLLEASQLSGDRRKLRYPRLRRAVKAGLESPNVLKVKRGTQNNPLTKMNYGVEPDLPQALLD
jgi:hypothetical protein